MTIYHSVFYPKERKNDTFSSLKRSKPFYDKLQNGNASLNKPRVSQNVKTSPLPSVSAKAGDELLQFTFKIPLQYLTRDIRP